MEKDNNFDFEISRNVVAGEIMDLASNAEDVYGESTQEIFDDEDLILQPIPITVGGKSYEYIPYGMENNLPYRIRRKVEENMILSQDMLFNIQTCYGQGVSYMDKKTNATTEDRKINLFLKSNSINRFFLEQCTDMKFLFWTVAVVILNRKGTKIVSVRHKDASNCRITKYKGLRSQYVLYGDFKKSNSPKEVEVIPMLDEINPIGDLLSRMGADVCPWTGKMIKKSSDRKFAVVCRFPTPGNPTYPAAYWTSALRDCWADIYKMIGIGKRAKLRNHTSVKYHVEIHKDYWDNLCDAEHITDEVARAARIVAEKEKIKKFLTGIVNSGKVWISGYWIDPNGKENNMVKISLVEREKEGGDWADDIQEASNIQCFATGVHPNLVGATPGKSQMNNSGSDKRELFTLKQSLEKAFHDMLLVVHELIIYFNGWEDKVKVDVPMIMLTTLDEHKDAQVTTANPTEDGNNNNN